MADMVWCCAAKHQKKFPIKRYSALVPENRHADDRSGRAIMDDLKDKLRKRKGVIS